MFFFFYPLIFIDDIIFPMNGRYFLFWTEVTVQFHLVYLFHTKIYSWCSRRIENYIEHLVNLINKTLVVLLPYHRHSYEIKIILKSSAEVSFHHLHNHNISCFEVPIWLISCYSGPPGLPLLLRGAADAGRAGQRPGRQARAPQRQVTEDWKRILMSL